MTASDRRLLIMGGSRGIGADAARHFADQGSEVLAVSRSPAAAGRWIAADVTTDAGLATIVDAVGTDPLDALLYLGGTWENGAFTDAYRFSQSTRSETLSVLATNLVAPIELTRCLTPNLAAASNGRAIFIGSTSGLEGQAGPEVANSASKFGLRGAVAAMRVALAGQGVGLTLIHPANVATPEVEEDIAAGRFAPQRPIPMADLLATLDYILSLSPDSDPGEITLLQRTPPV